MKTNYSPERKIRTYIELDDLRGIKDVLNNFNVDINQIYYHHNNIKHVDNFITKACENMNFELVHFFHDKGCNILVEYNGNANIFECIKLFMKRVKAYNDTEKFDENSDYNIVQKWIYDSNTQIRLINAQTDVVYVLNDLGMLNDDVKEKFQHLLTAKEINIL